MRFCSFMASIALLAPTAPLAAQTRAEPGLGGTAVPGICLLSREAVFANAKVGIAASARLKQISDEAQAEIDTERKPLDADIKLFQTDSAKLAPAQREAREKALSTRLAAVQAKTQLRSREIDATRAKILERIANEARPVIAEAYAQKKCGLLLDRSVALGGNFANDLTADVVRGLDAKMTTINFDRERLPQQQQPGAAPAR